MELTSEEVERYLNRIFTGQELVEIDGRLFIFKQPDNDIKAQADLIYDKAYKRATDQGMLPIAELGELIKKRGIFSEADEVKLEELKSQKYAQEVILSKTTKMKDKQDRLRGIINGLEDKINTLESKRTSKLIMSVESKAEEERALYFCYKCVYDDNFNRYWDTFEDLLNEKEVSNRDAILIRFMRFKSGLDTSIIRFLARHSLWRIRYVSSQKVSDPLFGVPTSQYTNDMLNLAYWSNFYQNIYEMMPKDRPSDSVIEDDAALDSYMKDYYEERNREDSAERAKGKSRGKLSAFDKDEVIVTRSNELYEDIKYDKPREARMIKDKPLVQKKTKRKRPAKKRKR